jgi:phosphoribosyl-ATP pyrophosphohydrolase
VSDTLNSLWSIIESRKRSLPSASYTTHLLQAGENEILKKIGEETIEVIVAAKDEGDSRLISEMADLIYHALVLLAVRDLEWGDVEAELTRRFR